MAYFTAPAYYEIIREHPAGRGDAVVAQDIVSLSNQVENINTMITELEQLLNT